MINRMLRYYLYAKRGIGHIGMILSAFTFVNTLYLVSREWVFFSGLGYIELMGGGFVVLVPILVYVGYLDYHKGFYHIESSISTEENPYLNNKLTEKEKQLLLPLSVGAAKLALTLNREVAESLKIPPEKYSRDYEALEKAVKRLEDMF